MIIDQDVLYADVGIASSNPAFQEAARRAFARADAYVTRFEDRPHPKGRMAVALGEFHPRPKQKPGVK